MSWNNQGRRYVFWGIIAILVFVFIFGCSGNSLSGTWETTRYGGMTLTFSGKNYTRYQHGEIREKGKYSIRGDNIEFVDSNGRIEAGYFKRTDNTLTIAIFDDTVSYTRKR